MENTGFFTISLDFELFWGIRDAVELNSYRENIKNVHVVIPRLLELFSNYQINATWCIVGFLFFDNKSSLVNAFPEKKPSYIHKNLDQYHYINTHELDPIYHFAPATIKLIQQTKGQEIGTHTFSHYFCLEKGQHPEEFKEDIENAITVLTKWKIDCKSIVFPRNQYNDDYLSIAKNAGIRFYRGNEKFWIYQHRDLKSETRWQRLLRLLDAYINISGHNTFEVTNGDKKFPINVPSSSFLRPYNPSLKFAEDIRYKRIVNSMTYAAINKKGYHLWWHPHNFGRYTDENFKFLEKILKHYTQLNKEYQFTSKAMCECLE